VFPAARATFMAMFFASTALGRSLGSLAAPYLYTFGRSWETISPLLIIVLAAVALNLAALFVLRAVHEHRAINDRPGDPA
jgi:MFS family permease